MRRRTETGFSSLVRTRTARRTIFRTFLVCVGEEVPRTNGQDAGSTRARLLAPLQAADVDDEDLPSKVQSGAVLQFSPEGRGIADKCRFLTGGDTEVAILGEVVGPLRLASRPVGLRHPVMPTSLLLAQPISRQLERPSRRRWSLGECLQCVGAGNGWATIVASSASSSPIDDHDPSCIGANRESERIVPLQGPFLRMRRRQAVQFVA